jgi:type II secretory pathway component GspD/PulD (secretin)
VQPLPLILALALAVTATAAPKAKPRTVTLDVKDAEAREVLQSMRKQCGIKNMVIDPDVQRDGASFYFREVPCETAFRVVLRTYGLTAQDVQVLR